MLEWLYNQFFPIFLVTGKVNYFEIILEITDNHYGMMSSELLHHLRCNRTVPLCKGKNKFGNEMTYWALDVVIENVQKCSYQKKQSCKRFPDWILFKNSSYRTKVLSFQRAGYPAVV